MLKTLKMARIYCPVGFSEKNICCFLDEKDLKLKPNVTKNPKLSNFQRFYAFFAEISTDFVSWNVENDHQTKNLWSSNVLWGDNCGFQVENISNWHWSRQKLQNFQTFKVCMQFLSSLWQTSWIGMLQKVNKEKNCCLVVFYEGILAVF